MSFVQITWGGKLTFDPSPTGSAISDVIEMPRIIAANEVVRWHQGTNQIEVPDVPFGFNSDPNAFGELDLTSDNFRFPVAVRSVKMVAPLKAFQVGIEKPFGLKNDADTYFEKDD